MVHLPQEYYAGSFVLVISRHFEASVVISTYYTQPSLPKKRKGPDKSFIEDAAVLSRSDDSENEEEDEDNNEYFRDDQQYSQNAMPTNYPTSSRTLFYSILSTNHIISTWLNMVWVHPNHNYLSLLN